MKSKFQIFSAGIIRENPLLVLMIGLSHRSELRRKFFLELQWEFR